jgi:predicted transcriptional regulator
MVQLTPNERQIMELIWDAGRPLSRQEILNGTEGRTWNPASIHLILNSMQSKGVLKITNEQVRYARTYDAVVSKEEYIAWCVSDVVPGKSPKEQILSVVSALLNRKGVNKEVVDELKELIDEKEKEL